MEKSALQEKMEKEGHISSTWVHRGKVISLRLDRFKTEGGKEKVCEILVHPGAVAIIPITDKNEVILVKQWRRASGEVILEIPAGTLEENEEPILCAQRELQEEIGFKADTLIPMGSFFTAPGFCTERIYLFLAKDLKKSSLPPDDGEAIDVVTMPIEEALRQIESAEIKDAKTIAGILRYYLKSTHEQISSK